MARLANGRPAVRELVDDRSALSPPLA